MSPVGAQRIRFDFNNLMLDAIGPERGLTMNDIDAGLPALEEADRWLKARRAAGEVAWMELPYQDAVTREILAFAEAQRGRFENLAVLGIGGSALGNTALQTALAHPYYNLLPADQRPGPRLFVLDNVDPDAFAGFLDVIDPATTLFNVSSKSGATAETMSQFLIVRDMLQARLGPAHKAHLVVTTDARAGVLRPIVGREGYASFIVPAGVGGRFSVFSPVGLLSAALCGLDVPALLAGAAFADQRSRDPDPWRNPAYMNALLQYLLYRRGQHISVMMPYSQRLRDVADWYRQLWAESLGKRHNRAGQVVEVGPTPVKALGVTDQHSQVQLYAEGPYDKVVNFIFVEHYDRTVTIPAGFPDMEGAAYLAGHSMNELIQAEGEATALALTEAGRPNCAYILPAVNAFTLGQLLYTLEVQTAISGPLYDVDPFDQPGVEAGKVATYALLGRPGYEGRRQQIVDGRKRKRDRFVIA